MKCFSLLLVTVYISGSHIFVYLNEEEMYFSYLWDKPSPLVRVFLGTVEFKVLRGEDKGSM